MKVTLNEVKSFIASYVDEARQAGAWNPTRDEISQLIEKVVKTFTVDTAGFVDRLPELDSTEGLGIVEEYFAGLVPAGARIDDGSNDELAPNRPTFDEASYSYPLLNSNGQPGIRFKTTVDHEFYQRYINGGNDSDLVNYIIKKLYDSYFEYKYVAKRQLIGNVINKLMDAQNGEIYTTNSTVIKCGHIYSQSSKLYIAKKNYDAAVNKTLATLAAESPATVVEIVPDMVKKMAKPENTETAEAWLLDIANSVEKLSIDATEGTSMSGSTIAAVEGFKLFVKPGIENVVKQTVLAGAFNKEDLSLPANVEIKTLPDFGTIDDDGVYAILMDNRMARLAENYLIANSTAVNGSLYDNYFLHYSATAIISKHCAGKVYTVTGA